MAKPILLVRYSPDLPASGVEAMIKSAGDIKELARDYIVLFVVATKDITFEILNDAGHTKETTPEKVFAKAEARIKRRGGEPGVPE